MGYYADGYGVCVLKEDSDPYALERDIEENGYCFDLEYGGTKKFVIRVDNQKYYEDDVYHDLNILTKYITSGYIEYTGEDDNHWRIAFKDGSWSETEGKVVYDMSNYSDQELIDELDRRGFGITQLFALAQSM